ncbi:MAG: 50S ribosomal protein L24 [Alphaproteobacteria bacterium]
MTSSAAVKNKLKVKKDDLVSVISGSHKGKTGKILKVLPSLNKVVVEGVGVKTKNVKPTAQNAGGILRVESPIHVSNVLLVDSNDGSPSRVGYRFDQDGKKQRFFKKSGQIVE